MDVTKLYICGLINPPYYLPIPVIISYLDNNNTAYSSTIYTIASTSPMALSSFITEGTLQYVGKEFSLQLSLLTYSLLIYNGKLRIQIILPNSFAVVSIFKCTVINKSTNETFVGLSSIQTSALTFIFEVNISAMNFAVGLSIAINGFPTPKITGKQVLIVQLIDATTNKDVADQYNAEFNGVP